MTSYRINTPKTVLILGSGAHRIGQTGEFDSSCLQAIKALKMEGIRTILINPEMTAVHTSEGLADATYFLPITAEFVESVIEKEHPDSLLIHFGGKLAYQCVLELESLGVLEQFNLQVLGTQMPDLDKAFNRESFVAALDEAGIPALRGIKLACGEQNAVPADIEYPVILRSLNSGDERAAHLCGDRAELERIIRKRFSETACCFVEPFLGEWKEVEIELLRDAMDNCIQVCSMESLDSLGIHNGDSLVVIPAQTLSGDELERMRTAAFQAARQFNIIGEATIRFALHPDTREQLLIEIAPRLSRSTAIASKASGYQIGYITTRISLGFALSETANPLTANSKFCTEPVFDCIALKMPRWDREKFEKADPYLGTEVKAVGEAMAFGRTFPEVLQKAVRMTMPGCPGIHGHGHSFKDIKDSLRNPTDERVFALYEAIRDGWSTERIVKHAHIDPWFISQLRIIARIGEDLSSAGTEQQSEIPQSARSTGKKLLPGKELLLAAKQAGFSDEQIAQCVGSREDKIRALRLELSIRPVSKSIDSTGGESTVRHGCLYMTYSGVSDDVKALGAGAMVLGSGPFHIGSNLEYEWCCASALKTIRAAGKPAIVLNCNPEAVSTDFDIADRVYFEELSLERVCDVYDAERPEGIILSMGGQIPNNLAIPLSRRGIPVLGTQPADIDRAEDRNKFSALLDQLGIQQPEWMEVSSLEAARQFTEKNGFPLLIRPSYVSSGAAMSVAWDDASLKGLLSRAMKVSPDHPVILTRYAENSKEIEIDAVANKGEILAYAISEHIENAGVHSGDATVVLPAQRIYLSTAQAIKKAARKIAAALEITGPFNIQFLAKSTNIQVIECNLRASRSLPFCSKVFHIDMAALAVKAQLGLDVQKIDGSRLDFDHVGVRAAQFSYSRMKGTDPVAGVEMASTGEVGCMGRGVRDAFMKAMLSTGYTIPKKKILLSTGPIENKVDFIESAKKLKSLGYQLAASGGTARFLQNHGIEAESLPWPLEDKHPNIADELQAGLIDLVINIPKNNRESELRNDYSIRRLSVDLGIPLITNIKIAKQFIDSLEWYKTRGLEVKSREEYT